MFATRTPPEGGGLLAGALKARSGNYFNRRRGTSWQKEAAIWGISL